MKIFIGYDHREDLAYQVCEYSVKKHQPQSDIRPLKQHELRASGAYTRPEDSLASTEFSITRFLVPYLAGYKGWAVFCDCDFLFVDDLKHLFDLADPQYAVQCVKHEYVPKKLVKMDGMPQYLYPRKNWSSLVLWNCAHPKNRELGPELVNTASGLFLHQFQWLADEDIGSLPIEWNWLVGWNQEPDDGAPRALHYTEGGPWFEQYRNCEYSAVWKQYLEEMLWK